MNGRVRHTSASLGAR